jgi:hypothetical protein
LEILFFYSGKFSLFSLENSLNSLSNYRSNFRRQNTIDAASIIQNTQRLAAQNQRPASAQPKTTTESSEYFFARSLFFSPLSERINY